MATRLAGSGDVFNRRGRKPWASVNFITAHDGFTLQRPRQLQRQAQRGQRRGQPRRPRRQPLLELRRRGADRRSGDRARCASGRSATCWRRCCCRRARRCCWRATSSAARSRATTTPIARTTRSAGSIGTIGEDGAALTDFVRRLIALRQRYPILRRGRFLTGALQRGPRRQGRDLDERERRRRWRRTTGTIRRRAASAC